MITGLHHFSLIRSSEVSVDFYKQLGFQEYKRISRDYDTVVLIKGYRVQMEIFIDLSHPSRNSEPLGLRSIALRSDNVEKTVEELKLSTGPVNTDWVGEKFCIVMDPDGQPIQLHE